MMTGIIITIIILLIAMAIYRSIGKYEVLEKTIYANFKDEHGWISMHYGNYSSCAEYVRQAKNENTELLGFKKQFKIKKVDR